MEVRLQRRKIGMNFWRRFFKRKLRKNVTPEVKRLIEDLDDHRPFFTYWITTVQILVLFISLIVYGFGPIGFTRVQSKGLVLVTSLSLQQVDYMQPANLFIGPSAFSPCMRTDKLVFDAIQKERIAENKTGCCIRNDESGCVQTSEQKCSTLLSKWVKWSYENPGPTISSQKGYVTSNRISGSVCGQDPKYCEEPASSYPHEWPDDITKWPICRKAVTGKIQAEDHMACELIGRPCCMGIYGECQITTREHCDFVKGFFHEEATLCSQVSCLEDVCGMIPFYSRDSPNQFYRLWISLFLHAGLLHLAVTVAFQFYIMRDIEKMIGSLRIAIIYMVSGIGGNLASSIFVPYRAEVGPSGSQFGLLACLIVEVLNSWQIIEHPKRSLIKLCSIAISLFIIGLLPWVDNYAHIFGFLIGFLLSLALLPYVTIKPYKQQLKCPYCQYVNCIPFTHDWCADQALPISFSAYSAQKKLVSNAKILNLPC
ncbi:inactive rhomboid protein 1-like protein [Leptotrombidium deliense]|uniref:Inactive rhomboid protein 1-like protein n=1 Tax=Leptotrombidium deliense TaxID=299467 RepID=A0A443SKE1_9ACAR|nr:inactive rhomboid protein 1-like protein [Leptotrombidium deliense]